jgi:hypothetical protein
MIEVNHSQVQMESERHTYGLLSTQGMFVVYMQNAFTTLRALQQRARMLRRPRRREWP